MSKWSETKAVERKQGEVRAAGQKWLEPKDILDKLNKKWENGQILRSLLGEEALFPLQISLARPGSDEMGNRFGEVAKWIERLRAGSKEALGYGYELVEKEILHRQLGRNRIPSHALIATSRDALKLLKKQGQGERFLELAGEIAGQWPALNPWISRYPHKVLDNAEDWPGILAVLDWFTRHPRSGLYLRQMAIPGIDTKFIEGRRGLLAELLDLILPAEAVDMARPAAAFELRYGLQAKPVLVRFRLLDPGDCLQGISDMTVPIKEFEAWNPAVSRVFITENEINGLCFPFSKNSLVIFKLGYGLDILKSAAWLAQKEIYYWGDIDTHGFAMLDQLRSFLPRARSLLMREDILLAHRNLWVKEDKPFTGQLTRLTEEEHRLFCLLQSDVWGQGVRLEQERISFDYVEEAVKAIKGK